MIPKEAIEKAIEGGWEFRKSLHWPRNLGVYPSDIDALVVVWQQVALSPDFWQSLGKALGWSEEDFEGFIHKDDDMLCPCNPEKLVQSGAMIVLHRGPVRWRTEAHNFFGIILTGGDTEKFWSDLLGSQSEDI